jgi:hypothetical protein
MTDTLAMQALHWVLENEVTYVKGLGEFWHPIGHFDEEEQIEPPAHLKAVLVAATLPPPTAEEMNDWADGIVYHTAPDGTLLRYDPEQRAWLPTNSKTSTSTSS